MEKMKTAVIYARYSSDKQREESIDGQLRICYDYAQKNGFIVVGEYIDRALTGKTDKRPQFLEMIEKSAEKAFRYVLLYKLDRFSRNKYDNAIYKHKLEKNGVKLVSATENIPEDPSGILLESVIVGLAEYYSAELSEKVLRGQTQNALELKWPGGVVPLGYKLDNEKHLIIDDEKALIVKEIFNLYLQGYEPRTISKILNKKCYTNAKGNEFKRSTVYAVLHNERYIGTFQWKDIKKPDAIPSIIDKDIFFKVQEKIGYMKKSCIRASDQYLLAGKVFCAKCGQKMVGRSGTSQNKTIYYYYTCPNKKCKTKNIRSDALEHAVYVKTNDILSSDSVVSIIAKQAAAMQQNKAVDLTIQSLKMRISDTQKKIDNCVKAIENGIMSDSITTALEKNESLLKDLKYQLSKEQVRHKTGILTEEKIRFFFKSIREKADALEKYKHILFRCFIKKILIDNDVIEIQYNYSNELFGSQNGENGGTFCHTCEHYHLIFASSYFSLSIARL